MKFQEYLRDLRIAGDMTQSELAGRIGVSEISVRNWERGAKKPSMDALIAIGRVFDVSLDRLVGNEHAAYDQETYLTGGERLVLRSYRAADARGKHLIETICRFEAQRASQTDELAARRKTVPRYETPSAAGVSVPLDGQEFEWIEAPEWADRADYAVRIQGRSMEPLIADGETVFVQRAETLQPGEIGIFAVDGAMYCKRYVPHGDGSLSLVSENPGLQDQNVTVAADSGSSVTCYGRVLLGTSGGMLSVLSDKVP